MSDIYEDLIDTNYEVPLSRAGESERFLNNGPAFRNAEDKSSCEDGYAKVFPDNQDISENLRVAAMSAMLPPLPSSGNEALKLPRHQPGTTSKYLLTRRFAIISAISVIVCCILTMTIYYASVEFYATAVTWSSSSSTSEGTSFSSSPRSHPTTPTTAKVWGPRNPISNYKDQKSLASAIQGALAVFHPNGIDLWTEDGTSNDYTLSKSCNHLLSPSYYRRALMVVLIPTVDILAVLTPIHSVYLFSFPQCNLSHRAINFPNAGVQIFAAPSALAVRKKNGDAVFPLNGTHYIGGITYPPNLAIKAISNNGIVALMSGNAIELYEKAATAPFRKIESNNGEVAFSPDGSLLVHAFEQRFLFGHFSVHRLSIIDLSSGLTVFSTGLESGVEFPSNAMSLDNLSLVVLLTSERDEAVARIYHFSDDYKNHFTTDLKVSDPESLIFRRINGVEHIQHVHHGFLKLYRLYLISETWIKII